MNFRRERFSPETFKKEEFMRLNYFIIFFLDLCLNYPWTLNSEVLRALNKSKHPPLNGVQNYLGLVSGSVVGNPSWPDTGDKSKLGESNPYGDFGEFRHPNGSGAAYNGGGGHGGELLFCGGRAFSCCCWYQRGDTKGAKGDEPHNSLLFESIANMEFWRYRM